MGFSVSVVVPAYNRAELIGETLDAILGQTRPPDEVVVVDDGSTDGTGDRARDIATRVLSHRENRGKGSALQTAFDAYVADGFDAVVTLDADGQHLPEEIPHLLQALADHDADLVLGTRDHLFQAMSAVRRTSNRVSSRLISFAAGKRFSDIQTGFRVYSRRLLESIRLQESGFDAESAVLVRAVRRGFRVATVPVRMERVDGRSTSHYRPVVDSLRIARAVISARFERSR